MTATEHVICELCGADEPRPLVAGGDRLLKHPGRFTLVRCARCGLVYQNPRPAQIGPFYEGSYLPFAQQGSTFRPLLRRHDAENAIFTGAAGAYYGIMRRVVPWPSGRLLDVGCGTGDFLVAMDHFGWQVAGVEPSPAARIANERLARLGHPAVLEGSLEQGSFAAASFDVVTLWHVIEHLPHPLATMREVARLLRPGGICLVQTPCWGSLESLLFGRYWVGLDLPRHFWIFSHLTLQALLERAGLRIWQRPTTSSYDTAALSTRFLADAALGERAAAAAWSLTRHPAVARLAGPLFRLIDTSGLGAQLTVAAVRPLTTG